MDGLRCLYWRGKGKLQYIILQKSERNESRKDPAEELLQFISVLFNEYYCCNSTLCTDRKSIIPVISAGKSLNHMGSLIQITAEETEKKINCRST